MQRRQFSQIEPARRAAAGLFLAKCSDRSKRGQSQPVSGAVLFLAFRLLRRLGFLFYEGGASSSRFRPRMIVRPGIVRSDLKRSGRGRRGAACAGKPFGSKRRAPSLPSTGTIPRYSWKSSRTALGFFHGRVRLFCARRETLSGLSPEMILESNAPKNIIRNVNERVCDAKCRPAAGPALTKAMISDCCRSRRDAADKNGSGAPLEKISRSPGKRPTKDREDAIRE